MHYSFLNEFVLLYPKAIEDKVIQIIERRTGQRYGIDYTNRSFLSEIMQTVDFLDILSKISKNYNIRTNFPKKIYALSQSLDKVTFEQFIYLIKEFIKYYTINEKSSNDYGIVDGKINKTISTL